jgi:hypothetical protein
MGPSSWLSPSSLLPSSHSMVHWPAQQHTTADKNHISN